MQGSLSLSQYIPMVWYHNWDVISKIKKQQTHTIYQYDIDLVSCTFIIEFMTQNAHSDNHMSFRCLENVCKFLILPLQNILFWLQEESMKQKKNIHAGQCLWNLYFSMRFITHTNKCIPLVLHKFDPNLLSYCTHTATNHMLFRYWITVCDFFSLSLQPLSQCALVRKTHTNATYRCWNANETFFYTIVRFIL